ncbi:MAG TPA: 3-oxoacyl-ACP synthase, partial [Clostridiales bacterium]|nr:3-oxoacyl-ACP synthase [Clostridiales bacterium]
MASAQGSHFGIRIKGTGSCVPSFVCTNAHLSSLVETSDEWIVTRTGIRERRISLDGKNTPLVLEASRKALENAEIEASQLDLIIVGTVTPDTLVPSQACTLQWQLGATCPAFDINAACSGFIYALDVAKNGILSGNYRNVLVVAGEVLSRITNWQDRTTCVLFGDGAGAVVLTRVEHPVLFTTHLEAEGDKDGVLSCPGVQGGYPGGQFPPHVPSYLDMNGHEVFKFAVRAFINHIRKVLKENHLTREDIRWIIPHQANIRILEAASQRLGIPIERFAVILENYGNTSGASIPMALDELNRSGSLQRGDKLIFVAFGGGLTS